MAQTSEMYYQQRAINPASLDSHHRAVRFFFLNRNCFNGIYRVNRQGSFNVPFGSSRTGALPLEAEWRAAATLLGNARLSCDDFDVFCRREVRRGDFVYLDPPYAVSNRRMFRQYAADSFGTEDMSRLRSLLSHIDRKGAKFVVSYAVSPEGLALAETWTVRRTRTLRNVAGFQQHRRRAMELIISNFDAPTSDEGDGDD
jgi:DNA adenine methylase